MNMEYHDIWYMISLAKIITIIYFLLAFFASFFVASVYFLHTFKGRILHKTQCSITAMRIKTPLFT